MTTSNNPAFDTRPLRKIGRYDNAKQIESKIDQAQAEALDLQKQADALDEKADTARATGKGTEWINGWRLDAAKLRKQAERKLEVRCKFLKGKLAAIKTDVLPFDEPELRDGSLPKVGSDKFMERNK